MRIKFYFTSNDANLNNAHQIKSIKLRSHDCNAKHTNAHWGSSLTLTPF
jgi:hypothetical protein